MDEYSPMLDALFGTRANKERMFCRLAVVAPRIAMQIAEEERFQPVISLVAKELFTALRAAGPFQDDESAWKAVVDIIAKQGAWLTIGAPPPKDYLNYEPDAAQIRRVIEEIKKFAMACTLIKFVQEDPDFQRVAEIAVSRGR